MAKENNAKSIGDFISEYRAAKAWSQTQIAKKLGVSRVTVARWENGESKPSTLAIQVLERLVSNDPELMLSQIEKPVASQKKKKGNTREIIVSPYVLNGPKDQNGFHSKLIEMQEKSLRDLPASDQEQFKNRLSLVKSYNDHLTAQYLLESPSSSAKSWNSNYGPHGWHRYVGRFPPHLVRALLNYFKATSKDLICDPFLGSGTTLVEARLLGVPSIGIEICPLSSLISRTKASFPTSTIELKKLVEEFTLFYKIQYDKFTLHKTEFQHADVLNRKGNNIESFANIDRWFTAQALLGVSLVTEFAATRTGYEREVVITALSAKMRSIGNVDVDVIRAEYSKKPRLNVDVLKLVRNHLLKIIRDIDATVSSHSNILAKKSTVTIQQTSLLDVKIKNNSISHIITSPPYGVESLSYLRTHLLSYRTLKHFIKEDPYKFGSKVIGSEYLLKEIPDVHDLSVAKISKTYRNFFSKISKEDHTKAHKIRIGMMMNFFQEMEEVSIRFKSWLKPKGKVAFVIGNKKIDGSIIPTDVIISEIFSKHGFKLNEVLKHKLKTNNSNSQVPWQDKIIEQEFVMIFQKK